MDSSTSKTSFFANWIKLFLILEKKSTSAQYVTKFVQCNIAEIFEHLLYFYTRRADRYSLTQGDMVETFFSFLETLNGVWFCIMD